MRQWLSELPKERAYITHMDLNPPEFKRQIFIVPVLLNLAFLALLAWRASVIIPWYIKGAKELWALRDGRLLEAFGGSFWNLIKSELRHFLSFLIDYVLVVIVAPWPYSFFFEGPGNPARWRLQIGFQGRELVVRQSRSWRVEDILHGDKKGDESPFWKTRVLPAIQMDKLSKTGYLLMDANWDLDFRAMMSGQKVLDERDVKENDLNGKMWCWWSETADTRTGQWVMWDFRHELFGGPKAGTESTASSTAVEGDVDLDEGRRMILKFKEKLEEMGKEELFYKWVELIQFESSRPGGFTKERQVEAGAKVKQLFDQYQVDFEDFEERVGLKEGRLVDEVD